MPEQRTATAGAPHSAQRKVPCVNLKRKLRDNTRCLGLEDRWIEQAPV
ncbi:MAG: hypothetical protein WCL48_12500 [Betaproteobacteria bacterium]